MAGLMQLKDWFTSLWVKHMCKWESNTTELKQNFDHLCQEHKAFWHCTATKWLITSQQWTELCQKQTEEFVELKWHVVMLERLLDKVGPVASTVSMELARSVDGLEDANDADEQVNTQAQSLFNVHPSFLTWMSCMSCMSAISLVSGSLAAEDYTDVDDDDLTLPPSETTSSYSPSHTPALTKPVKLEPTTLYPKAEIKTLIAKLQEGQTEFGAHLIKYETDWEMLHQGWDKLVTAVEQFNKECKV